MGGVCSGGTKERNTKLERNTTKGFSGKLKFKRSFGKQKVNSDSHSDANGSGFDKVQQRHDSGDLGLQFSLELKPSTPCRISASLGSQRNSFLGRASIVGLEKAIDVIDTFGSSMSNLNAGTGFVTGLASRGHTISILAFEVANTIAKGANLLRSLSDENIQFLKKEVLQSEGVQNLVSTNMKELHSIAAADKREELDSFSREVIRFGDLCKDPQWHNLGRYFSRLDVETSLHKQDRTDADHTMQELTSLAQHTSELYHELNAQDRFDQDVRQKLEELESLNLPKKGENLMILKSDLKQQKKLVRSLKKKSLWSRTLEEIVEKFVDLVTYMHQAISDAFGDSASVAKETTENNKKLGVAGLALHYANVIHQIDKIVARPAYLPPNIRDTLYRGLPPSVKKSLRSRLQSTDTKEERSVSQVKDEMEKTLQWLVPVAMNTTKAHQGFGWVGEWANTGNEYGRSGSTNNTLTRLQTLYHANKQKTDAYILELVAWLHQLISLAKQRDFEFKPKPVRSPTRKGFLFHSKMQRFLSLKDRTELHRIELCEEDRNLLKKVTARRLIPGVSKSQEFPLGRSKRIKVWALSRSTGNSPDRSFRARNLLKHAQTNRLDVMDGLDLAT
ncbi:putative Chaperone protein dnaJ 11, chloroplast precursor [Hibiscus syriacus]|uniref:Chaperone protein dnaJ 11, chloroplast n=1 Tax=Hibiscus syriacus TaxID=106335 RepID=A0A6A3BEU1_HIBSY|nr:protein PSK SIMULATOR 2-like [Hibiscus syriacus]KAE8715556.1 putative Chaperone protein dnaJ 11, chloroplast precursor [Hibiscus syriacus]